MSARANQVAVLGPRGAIVSPRSAAGSEASITRLTTFGALALYATVKWSTLVIGHPLGRLLGLYALAMVLAAGRPWLARYSRLLAALATAIVLIAAFPVAGVQLSWVYHVRIAVTANAIGEGLSALPQVLVPYSGVNHSVDLVMNLGAAVLLFDAALLVAFTSKSGATLRRAGAALPLVALAAVPTTIVRPSLPYVDGAILFSLLVAFMWGEQIGRRRTGGALGVGVIAVLVAMFLAPALDRHKPWFNYRALAGGLGPSSVDGFDWSQGYGRIDWPRSGRVVLEIRAARPEYWKAEDLDLFNGVGWAQGAVPGSTPSIDASATARWTQPIQVTIEEMRTYDVIGAGIITQPPYLSQSLNQGISPGTFTTAAPLGPGDGYRVNVYVPDPSPAQLGAAGTDYAGLPKAYRTVELPPASGTPSPSENFYPEETPNGDKTARGYEAQLVFPAFGSHQSITSLGAPTGATPAALLRASDRVGRHSLADAYRLAEGLAAGAATPYQFAIAVKDYLARGFTYNEDPPPSSYPLMSFLFSTHLGYCQQFAGAMALLLRMGGVPARVAVGFTAGREDAATGRWVVTDYDAHSWVEVWFPHYGWVTFDPTPSAKDPAQSGRPAIAAGSGTDAAATGAGLSASKTVRAVSTGRRRGSSARAGRLRRRSAGAGSELPWIAAAAAVLALALGLVGLVTRPLRSVEELVAELDGALRRIGKPLPGGGTLTLLERRVGGSPGAAAYVRALRLARFRGAERLPSGRERRALRRQLRLGLGALGIVRSIWALPPRWGMRASRSALRRGGSQTRAPHTSGA